MKLFKILPVVFVILFATAAIATAILNIILPKKIRLTVSSAVETSLHKNVEIKNVRFNLDGSITLKGITIYEYKTSEPYLAAKEISIFPFYPSLLSKRIFIISSIKAKGIYLHIIRNEKGKLNLPYIKQENSSVPRKIFIKKIYVSAGTLKLTDEYATLEKTLRNITVSLRFSFGPKILFRLETNNGQKDVIKVEGKFDPAENKLNASVYLSKVQLSDYKAYLNKIADLNSAIIEESSLVVNGKDIYSIKGEIKLEKIDILKQSITFNGKAYIRPNFSFDIKTKRFSYNVSGSLYEGELENVPYLDNFGNLNLSFNLNKDNLTFSSLETIWRENKIEASGNINDFSNPFIDLNIKYKGKLDNIKTILQKAKLFSLNIPLTANSAIEINIKGNPKENNYSYHGLFSLKNASIAKLNNVSQIQCDGTFDKESINIKTLSLLYKNIPLTGSIQIKRLVPASIKADIKSPLFNTAIEALYKSGVLTINEILLKGEGSELKTKGYINTENRAINASLSGYISIDSIENTFKELDIIPSRIIDNISLEGTINVDGKANGKLGSNEWQAKISGSSDIIELRKEPRKAKLRNIKFTLYADKDELIVSPFNADICKGKAQMDFKFDLSDNHYIFDIVAKEIDLVLLKKVLALRNKKLSGKLSFKIQGENRQPKDMDSINATGAAMVEDGNIWEMSFMKGLGEFLFIPDFENIIFSRGFTEFTIKNKTIFISNLQLESPQMSLAGEGNITFAGNLDFMLYPDFNPYLISASEGLRKIFTNVAGKTGLTIEIKGTIDKPRYKFKSILLSPINSIKDLFKGLLQ